jgi:hypothetical protein
MSILNKVWTTHNDNYATMQIPDIDTEILDGPDLVTLKTLEEWESIFNNNSYPYHKIISYSPIYD